MPSFLTISSPCEGIYKEKGSKFLSYAFPVSSEIEIKEILENLKHDHPKARHVCYAYRLGAAKSIFRFSDDGEPHNSAGAPIYSQIKSFDLSNVLIAVVRYFGGTKLGVSGLTSAYKEAARNSLEVAEIVPDIERIEMSIQVPLNHMPELMNFVKQNNVRILVKEIGQDCIFKVSLPLEIEKEFNLLISNLQK